MTSGTYIYSSPRVTSSIYKNVKCILGQCVCPRNTYYVTLFISASLNQCDVYPRNTHTKVS